MFFKLILFLFELHRCGKVKLHSHSHCREFANNFRGSEWGHNGPAVLTRVLQKICNVKYTSDMTPEKCRQFQVFEEDKFYAIKFDEWQKFFNSNDTHETLARTNNSIAVHVWNKFSSIQSISKTTEKNAYGIIASKNCPRVFKASGELF